MSENGRVQQYNAKRRRRSVYECQRSKRYRTFWGSSSSRSSLGFSEPWLTRNTFEIKTRRKASKRTPEPDAAWWCWWTETKSWRVGAGRSKLGTPSYPKAFMSHKWQSLGGAVVVNQTTTSWRNSHGIGWLCSGTCRKGLIYLACTLLYSHLQSTWASASNILSEKRLAPRRIWFRRLLYADECWHHGRFTVGHPRHIHNHLFYHGW